MRTLDGESCVEVSWMLRLGPEATLCFEVWLDLRFYLPSKTTEAFRSGSPSFKWLPKSPASAKFLAESSVAFSSSPF